MSFDWLSFLSSPAFVICWYALGVVAAAFVIYDVIRHNTPLNKPVKWAWPILVVFFSLPGLAVYLLSCRPKGIGRTPPDQRMAVFEEYSKIRFRKVTASVTHCVGGDGLGIVSAMVLARALRMPFWLEFWFEYAVGFCFGWFIFQYAAMKKMADSTGEALWMSARAEFFSMLTVMAGMGTVMAYVTPKVVGQQPTADTAAFWGLAALGLAVGFLATYPMNWLLTKIKWKHGLGHEKGGAREASPSLVVPVMAVMGLAALCVPAALFQARISTPVEAEPTGRGALDAVLSSAQTALERGESGRAAAALDAALRLTEVHRERDAEKQVRSARKAFANGRRSAAARTVKQLRARPFEPPASKLELRQLAGVGVVDGRGNQVGEVVGVERDGLRISESALRDVFGFIDLSRGRVREVPYSEVSAARRSRLRTPLVGLP